MSEKLGLYESPAQDLPGLESYEIRRGLSLALAARLIEKSKEPEIIAATPKDSQDRFKDLESIERWNLNRYAYPLVDTEMGDLAGIVWYGPKSFPIEGLLEEPPEDTFGIRLYEGYRGQRLALPFMKHSLADYIACVSENGRAGRFHGVWLSTEPERKKAVPLFRRFGYTEVARKGNEIIMVLEPQKIRGILAAGEMFVVG